MNAEVVFGVIENKQDAVDYLTWTFMYRRLTKNPNCYNLQGVSHRHLSDHLSELVKTILNDLESSKCVAIEEDMHLKALNLGLIASYYYISYTTIERFSSMLTQKTKMKGLLEILASASEYAELPNRPGEEEYIERLVRHQRFSIEKPKYGDPHVKANALLQAHFSRHTVVGNLAADQREILLSAHRLLQAMNDVISSYSWPNGPPGSARPGMGPLRNGHVTRPCRAARRAASSAQAWHKGSIIVPGRADEPDGPWRPASSERS
jgi:pre-mRNA-splicing helicase BRR2